MQQVRDVAGPVLDADAVRRWARAAVDLLAEHRPLLDAMNVFPVPDSDTGTNLWLTLSGGAAALDRLDAGADVSRASRALARGAVVGSRGNSGVIVGQWVAGLLEAVADGAPSWGRALERAAAAAYGAVARPVEGTVLTLAREVAAAAEREDGTGRRPLERGVAHGWAVLERTSAELPVLARAGVCDAGAWGLLLVLVALTRSLGGEATTTAPTCADPTSRHPATLDAHVPCGAPAQGDGGPEDAVVPDGRVHVHHDTGGEFEVMFLVGDGSDHDAPDHDAPDAEEVGDRLRVLLAEVGDSVAVVGAGGLWQAHVHTDDPLAALRLPSVVGAPTRPAVVRHLPTQAGVHAEHRPGLGLVAVTAAPGLAPELARAGAVVVLARPGTVADDEVTRAVEDTGADEVLVLAATGTPTRAAVPGVHVEVRDGLTDAHLVAGAAAMAQTWGRPEADARAAVTEAVDGARTAEVAHLDGGTTEQVDAAVERVRRAVDALLADAAEVVTLVVGAGVPGAVPDGVLAHLARSHPGTEVVVLAGGPGADVVVGVE